MYRRRGGLREELKAEIRAQIEKFLAGGLFLSHISGHYNLHLHPTVLSILRELASEYQISAVRKPCASLLRSYQTLGTPHWQRMVELTLLRPALAWGRARSRSFLGVDRVESLNDERPATEHA